MMYIFTYKNIFFIQRYPHKNDTAWNKKPPERFFISILLPPATKKKLQQHRPPSTWWISPAPLELDFCPLLSGDFDCQNWWVFPWKPTKSVESLVLEAELPEMIFSWKSGWKMVWIHSLRREDGFPSAKFLLRQLPNTLFWQWMVLEHLPFSCFRYARYIYMLLKGLHIPRLQAVQPATINDCDPQRKGPCHFGPANATTSCLFRISSAKTQPRVWMPFPGCFRFNSWHTEIERNDEMQVLNLWVQWLQSFLSQRLQDCMDHPSGVARNMAPKD